MKTTLRRETLLALSQQLRLAMSVQGVSQADLAGRSGIARKTIVNILNGSHAARSDVVQILAHSLGLKVSQLVEIPPNDAGGNFTPARLTDDEARLVSLYRACDVDGRSALIRLGEELASMAPQRIT